jgi:hypothetical protein
VQAVSETKTKALKAATGTPARSEKRRKRRGKTMNRIFFRVSKPGHAVDQTGYEYKLPAQLAHLNRGDKISLPAEHAPVGDSITSNDAFIETGEFSTNERTEFETAGPESKGSWTVRTGNPNYSTGKPHDGKFSRPGER